MTGEKFRLMANVIFGMFVRLLYSYFTPRAGEGRIRQSINVPTDSLPFVIPHPYLAHVPGRA